MKNYLKSRWDLVKVDPIYRSGFRLASILFGILPICFLALPSITFTSGSLQATSTTAIDLFGGQLIFGDLSYTIPGYWSCFLGYLLMIFIGFVPFLANRRGQIGFSIACWVAAFILIALCPVMTMMHLAGELDSVSFSFERGYERGYILALVWSFAVLICHIVTICLPPKDGWPKVQKKVK